MTKTEEDKSARNKKLASGASISTPAPTPTPSLRSASLTPAQPSAASQPCPPDVEELGRSAWTLLHTITATYPKTADVPTQAAARGFLTGLAKLYPCWSCATHFDEYIRRDEQTRPKVGGRAEFGWWMCLAHNDVNKRLGKPEFDCNRWEERWAAKGREDQC